MRRTITTKVRANDGTEQDHTVTASDNAMEIAAFILSHADSRAGEDVSFSVRSEPEAHDGKRE